MLRLVSLARLLPLLGLTACQGLQGGGCEHVFEDPVLEVRLQVIGPVRPAVIALTGFQLNGRTVVPLAAWTAFPAFEARVQSDTLLCAATCGFGFDEGVYRFTAGAAGFSPETVTVDARYAHFAGGCPSSSRGSTQTTITLHPSSGAP